VKCAAPDADGGINGKIWFQARLWGREVFAFSTLIKPAAFNEAMQLFASRFRLIERLYDGKRVTQEGTIE
jgi:hypothetical protein